MNLLGFFIKFIINRTDCLFKITSFHTYNNMNLTRTRAYHLDIDTFLGKGGESPSRHTLFSNHTTTNHGNKGNLI